MRGPTVVKAIRNSLPGRAAVLRAMQVDATTDDVVRIRRMNDDGVVIGDLLFALEMLLMDRGPIIAAVRGAKDAQQPIIVAGFVHRERVKNVWLRRADRQGRAAKARWLRQILQQMLPVLAAIGRAPNAAARSLLG